MRSSNVPRRLMSRAKLFLCVTDVGGGLQMGKRKQIAVASASGAATLLRLSSGAALLTRMMSGTALMLVVTSSYFRED